MDNCYHMRKTIGLALGSGSVRGMVHVGVIKTLLKYNIPIDFIAGSSVGAWVGGHFALYKDIERLEKTTIGNTREKLFALFEPSLSGGIIKGDKMEKLLSLWLENKEFKDTTIPFRAVATNLVNGEKIIFSEGKLSKALRASMSIPTFLKPVKINNMILVDGGISDPVPVDILKNMGAQITIAVNLDNREKGRKTGEKIDSFSQVYLRTFEIFRHHLGEYASAKADIIISPSLKKEMYSWKEYFTNKTGPKIMKIGEEETEKIIPKLKELLK